MLLRLGRWIAVLAILGSGTALARNDNPHHGPPGRHGSPPGGHGAPEPLTLVGLAAGATAIGAAAQRMRRKDR